MGPQSGCTFFSRNLIKVSRTSVFSDYEAKEATGLWLSVLKAAERSRRVRNREKLTSVLTRCSV